MLRNFHYIDEKGKDEGLNGTYLAADMINAMLVLIFILSAQSCTGNRRITFRRRKYSFGEAKGEVQPPQVYRNWQ